MMPDRTMPGSGLFLPALSLCSREIVRFFRQRSRIAGVLASPLVFWFLIGSGFGGSFRYPDDSASVDYLEYFYPGTIVLVILFTAIFSTISVIEDRREGFLQSVLVAPVSRTSIALGKILGGTFVSLIQGVLILALAPILGIPLGIYSLAVVVFVLFIVAFALTGLGFAIAWRMDSTQGFHAVMNLFLVPLWLLSGALFPASGAVGWLSSAMKFNPLAYGVAAVRQALYLDGHASTQELSSFPMALAVIILFAVGSLIASSLSVRKIRFL